MNFICSHVIFLLYLKINLVLSIFLTCRCFTTFYKVAFVAGVADSSGYGWAICKALAEAGATVTVGTWPPVLTIFQKSLQKGSFDEDSILSDGSKMKIAKVALDFCTGYTEKL